MVKIKLLNLILFIDFILYIASNLIIFRYSPSSSYSIFSLCIRDILVFLFSIAVYSHMSNVSSLLVFPKINSKIIKNSIIIGVIFYFVGNGVNLIFTNIFDFALKGKVYLNGIQNIHNLGFGLIVYVFLHSILTEIFFRGILNDAFSPFSYRVKLILSSFIFSIFFYGPSQIAFGFTIGVLLMSLFIKIGNILPIIISSITINSIDFLAKLLSNSLLGEGVGQRILLRERDVFVDIIFPIIIILIGFTIYPVFRDKVPIKAKPRIVQDNVTEVNFNNEVSFVDKFFLLFLITSIVMQIISYFFMN